jgi:hypothetical protein
VRSCERRVNIYRVSIALFRILGVASAEAGIVGTFLYLGSFAFEPLGSFYTSGDSVKQVAARSRLRLLVQMVGLGFLMLSFALGVASVFAS